MSQPLEENTSENSNERPVSPVWLEEMEGSGGTFAGRELRKGAVFGEYRLHRETRAGCSRPPPSFPHSGVVTPWSQLQPLQASWAIDTVEALKINAGARGRPYHPSPTVIADIGCLPP